MRSCTSSFRGNVNFSYLGFSRSHNDFSPLCPISGVQFDSHSRVLRFCFDLKVAAGSFVGKHGFCFWRRNFQVDAMDEGSVDVSSLDGWGDVDGAIEYVFSSSEGEDSDGDFILQSITDVDLPTTNDHFHPTDDTITVTAHRFAILGREPKKRKTIYGILNNIGLMTFLTMLILLVDCCAWRIVRLPLKPFYLVRPFFISTAVVSSLGYVSVPLLRSLRLQSIVRKGLVRHPYKMRTPTMGGLYFIPVGIVVAETMVGFSSIEVNGASAVTLAFAAIGLLDDLLSVKNNTSGLSFWTRILLEVAVTSWFSFWLCTTDILSPYSMYTFLKLLVPLPAPLGLVCLGRFYPILTSFCFISMANGVDSTDGLDGLAGGIAALAFIGMSIAVLPICSDLAVFGASMAGACVGFLFHNRYKASIFMGDTGSLALGGALAAMAACTGMFFPLFISSGIFVLEALPIILQVSFFKTIKKLRGNGSRLFRMAPFHHHLQLFGMKEPIIVAGAYAISSLLILYAGYMGLISA